MPGSHKAVVHQKMLLPLWSHADRNVLNILPVLYLTQLPQVNQSLDLYSISSILF